MSVASESEKDPLSLITDSHGDDMKFVICESSVEVVSTGMIGLPHIYLQEEMEVDAAVKEETLEKNGAEGQCLILQLSWTCWKNLEMIF